MKTLFAGYYQPTDDELSEWWTNGFFVLDANILLNLYCYSPESVKEFLDLLAGISERLWIPHQVALEYQRGRITVIENQHKKISEFQKSLTEVERTLSEKTTHPYISEELTESLKSVIADVNVEINKQKQRLIELIQKDQIRDAIDSIFRDRIGLPFDQEQLDEIYDEGTTRFEHHQPPGFDDAHKGGIGQYGDLVLWFQIIEEAKKRGQPVMFVTADSKSDWWRPIGLRNEKYPHPELRQEMKAEANVDFYMYSGHEFLKNANQYLGTDLSEETIEEVHEIAQQETIDYPASHLGHESDIVRRLYGPESEALARVQEIVRQWFAESEAMRQILGATRQPFAESVTMRQMQEIERQISARSEATTRQMQEIERQIAAKSEAMWQIMGATRQPLADLDVVSRSRDEHREVINQSRSSPLEPAHVEDDSQEITHSSQEALLEDSDTHYQPQDADSSDSTEHE